MREKLLLRNSRINVSISKWCLLLLLASLISVGNLSAQQASTYTYTTSTGASLDNMSGSSQLIGGNTDDSPSSNTNIGFAFDFEGISYTTFSVTPDGFLKLGAVAVAQYDNNMTSTTNIPKICPWWDDINTSGLGGSGSVSTVLRGSSPNRIRVVQWNVRIPRNTGFLVNANSTFQVWLYENGDIIEMRYGSGSNGTSSTIGIRGATASPASYISVTSSNHSSSTTSANNSNTSWPGSGRMYKFTPPPPANCSGTPSPGNTNVSSSDVCPGTSVSLSLQNATTGLGVIYQWQYSASSGGPWTNFGSNSSTQSASVPSDRWYRCVVTCSFGGAGNSNPVLVTTKSECECISYCSPNYSNYDGTDYIAEVSLNGWTNSSGGTAVPCFANYTGNTTTTLYTGFPYSISIKAGSGSSYNIAAWIDFNHNGTFESSERLGQTTGMGSNQVTTFNFIVPSGALTGLTRLRVVDRWSVSTVDPCQTTGYGETEDYCIDLAVPPPCSGTPVPGNTIRSANSVCPGSTVNLSLANQITGTGVTYQWQSGPSNTGPWTNFGSGNPTQSVTVTVATWYRCAVSCAGGGTGNSTARQVTTLSSCQCAAYCVPSYSSYDGTDYIAQVSLNGWTNSTGGTAVPCYDDNTGAPVTTLYRGNSYSISIKAGTGSSYNLAAFIDFNSNGTFNTADKLGQSIGVGNNGVVTYNFQVPANAVTGDTRLRVVDKYSVSTVDACQTTGWGETEDYCITITDPPPCSGTPAPGNTLTSATTTCQNGGSVTLSLQNQTSGTGITYQWQSSASSGGPWSDFGSGSDTQIASPTATTWYRCVVSCSGGGTGNSNPVQVNAVYCCEYTFRLTDSFGDGWNGATMQLRIGTTVIATLGTNFTSSYGYSYDEVLNLVRGTTYNLYYNNSGTYPGEVGIRVINSSGVTVYNLNAGNGNQGQTLFTFASDCPIPCTGTPNPGNTISSSPANCPGGSINLSMQNSSTDLGLTYKWQSSTTSASGPWSNFGSNSPTATASPTVTTWYRVLVTCTNSGQIGNSNPVQVTYTPPPTLTTSTGTNTVCRGNSMTITCSSSANYFWNTGETTQSISVSPESNSTTYSVVTGSGTCATTSNITILARGPQAGTPIASGSGVCPGSSINLQGSLNTLSPVTKNSSQGSLIEITGNKNADPFPSSVTVSGLVSGALIKSVKLNRVEHSFASDLDIALRSPSGQVVILMADVGGSSAFDNAKWLVIEDGAPQMTSGNFPSGTYSPTNLGSYGTGGGGPFPVTSPTPAGPYGSSLSYFTGNLNGTWQLYVFDDANQDGGSIQSWSIEFTNWETALVNGAVTYSWTSVNGFSGSGLNVSDTPSQSDVYTMTAMDNSCSSSSTLAIDVFPSPSVTTYTNEEFCANSDVEFFTYGSGQYTANNISGSLTLNIDAPGQFDEVGWSIRNSSNNILASGSNYSSAPISVNINPTYGDYPVTLNIETQGVFNDNDGVTYSLVCSLGNNVLISGTMDGGQNFTSQVMNCSVAASSLSYSWSGPDNFVSTEESPVIYGAQSSASGTYTVTIIDGNGCASSATTDVDVHPNPELETVSITPVACLGQTNGQFRIRVVTGTGSPLFTYFGSPAITPNASGNFTNRAAGTYTMFVSDANGCQSQDPYMIEVPTTPNEPPSIVCPSDITRNTDAGACGAVVTYVAPVGTDACPGYSTTRTQGMASGSFFPIGTTTITHVVTDAQGLTASCSFDIIVEDHEAPNAICKPVTVQLNASGNGSISVPDVDNGSNDACGIQSLSLSNTSFTCADIGTQSVVLTVEDVHGNISTCIASVTVEDNVAPVAQCQPVVIYLDASGNASTSAAAVDFGSNDACGIASVSLSKTNFDCSNVGNNPVVLTVTDNNGNTSTCNTFVSVIDDINPVITCNAPVNVNNDPNKCGAVVNYSVSASDNCPGYTMIQTAGLPSGSLFPVGTTVNSYMVTDYSGNMASCSFSVSVTDTEYPSITNVPVDFAMCNPVTWTAPTISDNCPGVQVTSTHMPGTNFPSGTTTVTYTATDVYGHVSTTSFNVTVLEPSVAADNITSNRDYNNICRGESITLTLNGGSLGEGAVWSWYAGGCGAGTSVGTGTTLTVSPLSTTTYYARAEGQCNITGCVSIQVVVSTGAPTAAVVYTYVPAFGAPGVTDHITVNPVPGATFYRWFTNNGHLTSVLFNGALSPVETTVPTVDISFVLPEQNYQIRVMAGNACGRTAQSNIHVRGTVEAPTSLNGPTLVCPEETHPYTVSSVPPVSGNTPVTYNWELIPSSAGTISGTGLTRNVTFALGFTSAQLCVNAISSFGLPGPAYCIVISSNAPMPGAVSGKALPCSGSTENYSIASVTGATGYNWSCNIAGSSLVVNGSGLDADVTFPAGAFSGTVCVTALSACGESSPSCFSVASGAPGTPGPISGPVLGICNAPSVNYSLSAPGGQHYNWLLPAGATIGSPNDANSVNINFGGGFTSGTITVEVFYDCGMNTSSINVSGEPDAPSLFPATICPGLDQLYFATSPTSVLNYNWVVTGNEPSVDPPYCTNPPICSQYYVVWSAAGGTLTVTSENSCGVSAPTSISTNCRMSEMGNLDTQVFPNPTSGKVTVAFSSLAGGTHQFTVTDLSGRIVLQDEMKAQAGNNVHDLNLGFVSKGLYMLHVKDSFGRISVTRLAVE